MGVLMPGYERLEKESVWRNQFVPPNLTKLVRQLDAHFDVAATSIGAFGDHRHLKGYHRSRNWILQSLHCTNRGYSVTETAGNRSGGNGNWISGVDIAVGYEWSLSVWERVNKARQRGHIAYVRQALLERDPWHVHLSLDRAHANDNHGVLFGVIIGNGAALEREVKLDLSLPELRHGSESKHVLTAQGLLIARGFETALDGDFGPDTQKKTLAMQQHFGAEAVDGIWGPETWTIAITGEDKL